MNNRDLKLESTDTEERQSRSTFLFSEIEYCKVKNFLQKKYSLNLEGYRDEYLLRRVSYHCKKSQIRDFDQYFQQIAINEKLASELIDVITVNVSYFFRDVKSFEILKREVLPELISKFLHPRIWSIGCSVGAEIYSIALILHSLGMLNKCDLTASDTDDGALNKAQEGIFNTKELKNLPKEYKKYFSPNKTNKYLPTYTINQLFKQSVEYQKHDVTSLEMIKTKGVARRYHLIVCRNLMIYFSQEIKEKLYDAFFDWLEPGGILFIGANELLFGPAKKKFEPINSQFYRKPERKH